VPGRTPSLFTRLVIYVRTAPDVISALDEKEAWSNLEKSIEYVALLYFLKRNRTAAEHEIFPYVRSINALKEARAKIDALARPLPTKVMISLWKRCRKVRPLPPGVPDNFPVRVKTSPLDGMEVLRRSYETIRPYPKQLEDFNRDFFFYEDTGRAISNDLGCQISKLKQGMPASLSGPGTSPRHFFSRHLTEVAELDDWIIEAIPRLRADPSMLILRILYRIFKIGGGKYRARSDIKEILLGLAKKNKKTYLKHVFAKIDENTNFETLRGKLYQKGARDLYDRLADYIYTHCFFH